MLASLHDLNSIDFIYCPDEYLFLNRISPNEDFDEKLTGYAYEEGINEMAISSMEDYVTQITILCDE